MIRRLRRALGLYSENETIDLALFSAGFTDEHGCSVAVRVANALNALRAADELIEKLHTENEKLNDECAGLTRNSAERMELLDICLGRIDNVWDLLNEAANAAEASGGVSNQYRARQFRTLRDMLKPQLAEARKTWEVED